MSTFCLQASAAKPILSAINSWKWLSFSLPVTHLCIFSFKNSISVYCPIFWLLKKSTSMTLRSITSHLFGRRKIFVGRVISERSWNFRIFQRPMASILYFGVLRLQHAYKFESLCTIAWLIIQLSRLFWHFLWEIFFRQVFVEERIQK